MQLAAFAKAAPPHLRQMSARVDSRSKAMQGALLRWLNRYARKVVEAELARQVKKADDGLRDDLLELIRLYGLRQMDDAARMAGGNVRAEAVDSYLKTKEIRIQGLMAETRDQIREDIRRVLRGSLSETPQPSAGEIARRIRGSYFGPVDARPFAVSSERAALIARTELAQAENTGIVEGYRATGVEWLEWLAYTDGESGDRHHERMNGKRVKLGEMFTNTATGNELRYPGDPEAPIKETANCRCSVRAVRAAA